MPSDVSDRIIEQIDNGELRPRTHKVCRSLADHLSLTEIASEVVHAFDVGTSIGDASLSKRLWTEIESLPPKEQGARRIVVSLLRPDESVDFHLADYLVAWSKDEGLDDATILQAFSAT